MGARACEREQFDSGCRFPGTALPEKSVRTINFGSAVGCEAGLRPAVRLRKRGGYALGSGSARRLGQRPDPRLTSGGVAVASAPKYLDPLAYRGITVANSSGA
jgi:hypothetical protein